MQITLHYFKKAGVTTVEKYKPEYLGKVIPADDPAKLTEFCTSQYEAFSTVYDACKDHSDKISDVKSVDVGSKDPGSFSVKMTADPGVVDIIRQATRDDGRVSINGDIITAKKP